MPQPPSSACGVRQSGSIALPAVTLWHREMVRFFRQRNRVASALITPIVLWLLLGSGLNDALVLNATGPLGGGSAGAIATVTPAAAAETASGTRAGGYREYFFTGTLTMILLFTAIFSTITVIEDRREGFLQGVLVAPVPRSAIVLGKVLGGATIAMIHALIFLLIWPWATAAGTSSPLSMVAAAAVCAVLAVSLTSLGLCIAWPMDSTAGFHAVMMLFLLPMWFLSGAVFPQTTAPPWLQTVMWCNPMTYGHAALSAALRHGQTGMPLAPWPAVAVTAVICVLMVCLTTALVTRSSGGRAS